MLILGDRAVAWLVSEDSLEHRKEVLLEHLSLVRVVPESSILCLELLEVFLSEALDMVFIMEALEFLIGLHLWLRAEVGEAADALASSHALDAVVGHEGLPKSSQRVLSVLLVLH